METLRPFFPKLLLRNLPDMDASRPALSLPGACLFADVSGFTAMSEALLAIGKEGSEVLTKVLNGFYAELVEAALARGGDVMRFAGDAVTVHFPDEGTARRAGLAMQALMPKFKDIRTPAGEFTLQMKVGIAAGEAQLFLVEGAGQQDYVYSGDMVDGCAEAEHHAKAGDVVVKRAGAFEKITDQSGGAEEVPVPSIALDPFALRLFLHPLLWETLESGQAGFLNEHRHISVLFAAFQPRGAEGSDPVQGVREFYRQAAERVAEYDGYINKVDMGDKGSKLLILFGAPRAHEDDEVRAVLCARKLLGAAKETGFSLRMGLNAAKVFCGLVGSSERCEYTVMGDGVNVAARLMQAAPEGDFLVSSSIRSRASEQFVFRDLPPLTLKGKREPFPVFKCEGEKGDDNADLSFFVGHEKELKALDQAIESQPSDRAGLYCIHGEAGVGKTALVRHWLAMQFPDHNPIVSRCLSHTSRVPYSAVSELVHALVAAGWEKSDIPLAERVYESITRRDPEVAEFVPILLNTYRIEENQRKEPAVEPDVRRSLLWKMTGLLVDEFLATAPMEWLIDGAQWMDSESRSLALHLVRMTESNRLNVFFTQREGPEADEDLSLVEIVVPPFSEEETTRFLRAALSLEELPPEALRRVLSASRGNPLLARETLGLMFRSGYLARDEDHPKVLLVDESKSPDLPDSMTGLILSRMDALPLLDRAILRALAVAGETASEALVDALALDRNRLQALVQDGAFIVRNNEAGEYRFSQPHTADAIYDSLEFTLRRELHVRIGTFLHGYLSPEDTQTCYTLAYHYGRAKSPQAIPFLQEVAKRANKAFAVAEAAHALETILEVEDASHDAVECAILDLAQLYLLTGRAESVLKLLNARMEQLSVDKQSRACRLLAEAYAVSSQIALADRMLKQALEKANSDRERFYTLCAQGKLFGKSGQMEKARLIIQKVDSEHRQFSADKEFKMNQMRLAFTEYQMGQAKQAIRTFMRLKAAFERTGDVVAAYTLGNNLGHLLALGGQNKQALQQFIRSFGLVKKYGIWESEIYLNLLINIGLQWLDLGAWSQAEEYLLQAYAYSKKFSSPLIYKPLYLLGEIGIYKGNLKSAIDQLADGRSRCLQHHLPDNEVLEQLMNLALILRNRTLFENSFRDYQEVVNKNSMVYLHAELVNFEAEGSLLFNPANLATAVLERNLLECMENEQYIEAFRSARCLLLSTRQRTYLEQMRKILANSSKCLFQAEFQYYSYVMEPTSKNKLALQRVLKRYPFADLRWKALTAIAAHEARAHLKTKMLVDALRITEGMLLGLAGAGEHEFNSQPSYLELLAMARELGISS